MKRTRLRRVSKAYAKELKTYREISKPVWLEAHPACEFEVAPGIACGETWGVTIHHKRRRGRHLNDDEFFMSVCRPHHDWIENNKRAARERGYILYD